MTKVIDLLRDSYANHVHYLMSLSKDDVVSDVELTGKRLMLTGRTFALRDESLRPVTELPEDDSYESLQVLLTIVDEHKTKSGAIRFERGTCWVNVKAEALELEKV